MSQRIELGAVVVRDGRLWMVRTTPGGTWSLPGGALLEEHEDVDGGMDAILAAFGITAPAIADDFLATHYLPADYGQLVYNLYAATEWTGEPLAPEGVGSAWFEVEELESIPIERWLRDALGEAFGLSEPQGRDAEVLAALESAASAATVAQAAPVAPAPHSGEAAYTGALDVLRTLSGGDPEIAAARLRETYPELGDDVVRIIGDFWTGPALDRRTRSLLVVAMLAALGGRQGPLRSHINGALNHGASPEQVVETLRMVAVYAGFPAALEAWPVMESVFEARGVPRPGRPR